MNSHYDAEYLSHLAHETKGLNLNSPASENGQWKWGNNDNNNDELF